jgi:hypothetical protein
VCGGRHGHSECILRDSMRSRPVAVAVPLVVALLALPACTNHAEVRVFVRDPRAVWVEAATPAGSRIVLPRGEQFTQVAVPIDAPPFSSVPSTATVFREPNGGITIDYAVCAVSPYAPLRSSGELTVVPGRGSDTADVVGSDGPNLRLAYRCPTRGAQRGLDLTLVTPWSNVREVHEYEH